MLFVNYDNTFFFVIMRFDNLENYFFILFESKAGDGAGFFELIPPDYI